MAEHAFDTLMAALDSPLIVVTTADQRERAGCLVEFHVQSSIEPQRYCVWLSKANYTYRVALQSSHLVIHFLTADDRRLAELFGTQTGDTVRQVRRPSGRFRARWRAGAPAVPQLAGRTAHRAARRGRRPRLPDHRTGRRPHCRAVPADAAVRGRLPEGGSRSRGTARATLRTSGTGLTAGQEPGRQSLLLAWSPESQRARSRWAFSFRMASIWATSGWSTVNSRSKPLRATPTREPSIAARCSGRTAAASSRWWPTSRDGPQAARPGSMSSAPKIPLRSWPV